VESSRVGEFRNSGDYVLRCPWHGYEFEVGSGTCPADPENLRVRSFPVSVEAGIVIIER
jgi:3-phenylpropionate/trans-cinnamate dioxygenase ferredoxin subunit